MRLLNDNTGRPAVNNSTKIVDQNIFSFTLKIDFDIEVEKIPYPLRRFEKNYRAHGEIARPVLETPALFRLFTKTKRV